MTDEPATLVIGAGESGARVERRPRRRPPGAAASASVVDRTRSYRHLANPFEPLKVFSDDQVAAIHEAALGVLENQGMRVLLPRPATPMPGAAPASMNHR